MLVTPVRIIGADEVSIGTGRNSQLLLPIPGEGDTQLLENLQIEDYIDAAEGGGLSRSTMKASSQAPLSSRRKNMGNLTTTTTTIAAIPSTPMKSMADNTPTTAIITEGGIDDNAVVASTHHASPAATSSRSSGAARDAWIVDTKTNNVDGSDGDGDSDGFKKSDHVVFPTPISLEPTSASPESTLDESVTWLSNVVTTQKGRDAFISALNQFRSKKVEVGEGFSALGAVLWDLLDQCR